MNLIKTDTQEYPISIREFKSRFPNTAFPKQINFESHGYAVVFPTPKPACTYKEMAREISPELTILGTWEQRWEVIDFTLDMTEEDLDAFYSGLKTKKKAEIKQIFLSKMEKPIVDTGLGFSVDGGRDNLQDFKTGLNRGYWFARDSNNIMHLNLSEADMQQIVEKIEDNGMALYQRKWELESLVEEDPDTDITTGWPEYS